MSVSVYDQLQPFEEHQSPSPVEEIPNPYELSLARSRSPRSKRSQSPPSPVNPTNSLHRQLSGDPDNPPPPWQRRASFRSGRTASTHSTSTNIHTKSNRSPSETSYAPPPIPSASARRHPNLKMTSTRPGMASEVFLQESPAGSSTSLNDDLTLTLPQPAFRRRAGGSNRSSLHSSQDLSSLSSEELWSMDGPGAASDRNVPDRSNPHTPSYERPLDSVRRMSIRMEHGPYHSGLPGDVIWPSAPPEEIYNSPIKSRSVTSMVSLGQGKRGKSRRGSRQPSLDIPVGKQLDPAYANSSPISPATKRDSYIMSSNNSSTTSLSAHALPPNKSNVSLSRPPSAYMSRDFLSSLAPREGGYAIAATIGNGLGAVGTMSADERRRSSVLDDSRPRTMSRAPVSRSAGMGRWSLDGGEHYGKPYSVASNNTTSTSLSARPSFDATPGSSPPADEPVAMPLPDGASPPASRTTSNEAPPPAAQSTTVPVNPSPLSRETPAGPPTPGIPVENEPQPVLPPVSAIPVPSATTKSSPAPETKKSKKELAKEAKAAEKAAKRIAKAEAEKQARDKAAAERKAILQKKADKEAAKRKEKEDKARAKAEKKKSKSKSSSVTGLAVNTASTAPVPVRADTNTSIPPVPPVPAALQSQVAPVQEFGQAAAAPRPRAVSHNTSSTPPASTAASGSRSLASKPSRTKLGMLGTIRKRLSFFGSDSPESQSVTPKQSAQSAPTPAQVARPPVPSVVEPEAAQSSSTPNDLARVVTPPATPLSSLPPRSTSKTADSTASPRQATSPQTFPSATLTPPKHDRPLSRQSASQEADASSPLFKSVSPDRSSISPSGSVRRGSSVRGPRPMPRMSAGHAGSPDPAQRPESIVIPVSADSHASQPSNQEIVTPSTSGESSLFSHTVSTDQTNTDMSSPFTSDGGDADASRKNSVLVDGFQLGKVVPDTPERESSDDTIHGGVPHAQTISAH